MAAAGDLLGAVFEMADLAIRDSQLLSDKLRQLQGTSKSLDSLAKDVQSLRASITRISTVDNDDWHSFDREVAANSLYHCSADCQYVLQRVAKWAGKNADETIAWRHRVYVRLCRRKATRALSERLQERRRNLDAVWRVTPVYSTSSTIRFTQNGQATSSTLSLTVLEVANDTMTAGDDINHEDQETPEDDTCITDIDFGPTVAVKLNSFTDEALKQPEEATEVMSNAALCSRCARTNWGKSGPHTLETVSPIGRFRSFGQSGSSCDLCLMLGLTHNEQRNHIVSARSATSYFHRSELVHLSKPVRKGQSSHGFATVLIPGSASSAIAPSSVLLGVRRTSAPDQEFAPRLINPSSLDYSLVREWLAACSGHASNECRPIKPTNPWGFRLILCQKRKVVLAPRGSPYVALSYVWGDQCGSSSSDDVTDFPQTVSDSMTVAMALGFEYLWVDRYCINQNNDVEKHHQIESMDRIYSEASLTIIAAAGEGPHYGLPGVSTRSRVPQRFVNVKDFTIAEMYPNIRASLRESKWSSRAWTLQEGFLSKRRLIFDDHQVSYVCGHGYCAESFIGEVAHAHLNGSLDLADFFSMRHVRSGIGHFRLVEEFLEEYTQRHLSHDSDVLNACLGILNSWKRDTYGSVLSGRAIETHLWGTILRSSASMLLNWYHTRPAHRRSEFPSWSWAGWKGPIRYASTLSDDVGKMAIMVYADSQWKDLRTYLGKNPLDVRFINDDNLDVEFAEAPRLLRLTGQCVSFEIICTPPLVKKRAPAMSEDEPYILVQVTTGISQLFRAYLDYETLSATELKKCVVMVLFTSKRLPEERRHSEEGEGLYRPFDLADYESDRRPENLLKMIPHERWVTVDHREKGHLSIFGLILKKVNNRFTRVGMISSELPLAPGTDQSDELLCNESGNKELNMDPWQHNSIFISTQPRYLRGASTRSLVVE